MKSLIVALILIGSSWAYAGTEIVWACELPDGGTLRVLAPVGAVDRASDGVLTFYEREQYYVEVTDANGDQATNKYRVAFQRHPIPIRKSSPKATYLLKPVTLDRTPNQYLSLRLHRPEDGDTHVCEFETE